MSPAEWIRDLRLALRLLAKNSGATALAVLSIALGIGLTTGLFAVGDAALLRPLPVEKPGELWSVDSRGDVQVGEGDDSEMAIIQPASPNYFQVLGVKPALGRASIGEVGGRPETV